jgi:hypothetical protein
MKLPRRHPRARSAGRALAVRSLPRDTDLEALKGARPEGTFPHLSGRPGRRTPMRVSYTPSAGS